MEVDSLKKDVQTYVILVPGGVDWVHTTKASGTGCFGSTGLLYLAVP